MRFKLLSREEYVVIIMLPGSTNGVLNGWTGQKCITTYRCDRFTILHLPSIVIGFFVILPHHRRSRLISSDQEIIPLTTNRSATSNGKH